MKKAVCVFLALSLLLCGCARIDGGSKKYKAYAADGLFEERTVKLDEALKKGVSVTLQGEVIRGAENALSVCLPLDEGTFYTVELFETPDCLRAVLCDFNPLSLPENSPRDIPRERVLKMEYPADGAEIKFSVFPEKAGEYLLVFLSDEGREPRLEIRKSVIIAPEDSDGEWWSPEGVYDLSGGKESFADYRWNADEVYANLFDSLCEKYPDSFTKEKAGRDQTDEHDINAYVFEPSAAREKTVFLVSGMHGEDTAAYFALAALLENILECENGSPLYYLKQHVRIVSAPIVNVWATYNGHAYRNSSNIDLNTDFLDVSQAETRALCDLLSRYARETDALFVLGCYNKWESEADLYYTCSSPFTVGFFKGVNHVYHSIKGKGLIKDTAVSFRLMENADAPESLSGCSRKIYGIPAYVLFHSLDKYYTANSSEGLSLALENFANVILSVLKKSF